MEVEIEDLTQKIEKNAAEYENADSERKRFEQDYGKFQQELNELSNDIKRRQKYESLQGQIRSWQSRRDESIKDLCPILQIIRPGIISAAVASCDGRTERCR